MGGSKPQPAAFITPPPPTITQAPAPQIQQNAADLYQAQLQYNPQLTAQAVGLQQQYGPQLAQAQFNQTAAVAPQYRQLLEAQYPQIAPLSAQVSQRLASPQGLTLEQQTAQDAIRQRQRDELSRTINTQANLGGTLYGGRNQENVLRAQAELANQYATTDIALQDQRRQQAISELLSLFQVSGLPVQQTQAAPQYGQGVTPSPDALLSAILQGQIIQQPIYQPGNPGQPGFFQSAIRGYAGQPRGFY